jgi:hypothetical protein
MNEKRADRNDCVVNPVVTEFLSLVESISSHKARRFITLTLINPSNKLIYRLDLVWH